MSKLTITTFLTMDGVAQAPGGPKEDTSGAFKHGGWLVPYADAEMGKFMTEVFARADAFLLGRRTYQIFAAHWPRVTDAADPIASALNTLPKHVASTTLAAVDWKNSVLVRDVVAEVAALKARARDRQAPLRPRRGTCRSRANEHAHDGHRCHHRHVSTCGSPDVRLVCAR